MTSAFKKRAAQAIADSDLRTSSTRASARLQRWRNQSVDDLATPWPVLRDAAAASRRRSLDNMADLLQTLESRLRERGVEVTWADDGDAAFRYIAAVATARGADAVLRSRSPLAEEIGLDPALASAGIRVLNTHFGDYILQLAEDRPSHPHFPAIHQRTPDVAALFERKLDMPQTMDVQAMGSMARFRLRRDLLRNELMIGQVALAAADTGTLALVSDAGEDRLAAGLASVQVLLMGIEQVTASMEELLFLVELGSRSASGRGFPGAVTLINGPAQPDDPDGPSEVHLVIVDNGRSALLASQYRDTLACIGCGACHNVCPVTREIGGHAYGDGRAGPIGAVMAPLQSAARGHTAAAEIPLFDSSFADLPLASTLCGACTDVCPVGIDLPEMLRQLREDRVDAGKETGGNRTLRAAYRWATATPANFGRFHWWLRRDWAGALMLPIRGWRTGRDLPQPAAKPFRERWQERGRR